MAAVYRLETEEPYGTNADSWADLTQALAEWVETPMGLDEAEERARAFAARAVLLAGGEAAKLHEA